jgi:hypothetical protein
MTLLMPSCGRALLVLGLALLLPFPQRADAQAAARPELPAGLRRVDVSRVAERLGIAPQPDSPEELDVGTSVTCTLAKPERLAAFGITGVREGARVTILRSAPDRLRIEADEIEPIRTESAVVRLDVNWAPVPKAKGEGLRTRD